MNDTIKELLANYTKKSIAKAAGVSIETVYRTYRETKCKMQESTLNKIIECDRSKLVRKKTGYPIPAEVYNYSLSLVRDLAGLSRSDLYSHETLPLDKINRLKKVLEELKEFDPEGLFNRICKENDFCIIKTARAMGVSENAVSDNMDREQVTATMARKLYYIWKEN